MISLEFILGLKLKVSVMYSGCGVVTDIGFPLLSVKLIYFYHRFEQFYYSF